jgi:hypothetical protein
MQFLFGFGLVLGHLPPRIAKSIIQPLCDLPTFEKFEELASHSGVLAADHVDFEEFAVDIHTNVLEVADRGWDENQFAAVALLQDVDVGARRGLSCAACAERLHNKPRFNSLGTQEPIKYKHIIYLFFKGKYYQQLRFKFQSYNEIN